jgi:hypothetical protein
VLASMQHVEDRARALRDTGMAGTWEELKVRALLDLLQERDSRQTPGESSPGESSPGAGGKESDGSGSVPAPPGGSGPGSLGPGGPSIGAQVTITVPATAMTGDTGPGGEVDGFGILDHADTRDLVAAAARNLATRWCVTVLNPDGTAAAHACAIGPRPWGPGSGLPGHQPGTTTLPGLLDLLNITRLTPVARGPCQHTQAEERYRPGRKLAHLVKARNTTCTAPGCGRRAARCDLDHTHPHHDGGLTCECNLAPLCRHHHRCKQADGWRLEQPQPGRLVWHTPAGRTYTTTPTRYAA